MNHFISIKHISAFVALWAYDNFVVIYSDMAHNACNLRGTGNYCGFSMVLLNADRLV